jgi:hypothetical protein
MSGPLYGVSPEKETGVGTYGLLVVRLDNNEVGDVWEVVCVAESKLSQAGVSHDFVGEFCGDSKKERDINGIVTGSVARKTRR